MSKSKLCPQCGKKNCKRAGHAGGDRAFKQGLHDYWHVPKVTNFILSVLAAVVLGSLGLLSISAKADDTIGLSMQDYLADPGVRNVYQECSYKGWPIVARLGNLRQLDPLPSKSVLFLFVKDTTVDIHLEYFRTPQGRYVVLTHFPASVVDKALSDFIKK